LSIANVVPFYNETASSQVQQSNGIAAVLALVSSYPIVMAENANYYDLYPVPQKVKRKSS